MKKLLTCALLLLITAVAVLVRRPDLATAFVIRPYLQQFEKAASGQGWVEKAIPGFTVRYRSDDPGGSAVEAVLPEAERRVQAFFTGMKGLPESTPVYIYPDEKPLEAILKEDFPARGSASHVGGVLIFHSPATWSAEFKAETDLTQITAHEYTHRVVDHVTRGRAPKWLHEGLATYVAGQYTPGSVKSGELLTFATINERFERPSTALGPGGGQLYAQVGSIIDYIERTHGPGKVQQVLLGLRGGKSLDRSLKAALGVDAAGLEAAWGQDVTR